jgi:hypothetical protein
MPKQLAVAFWFFCLIQSAFFAALSLASFNPVFCAVSGVLLRLSVSTAERFEVL